ncbi:tRNA threonylcarbamoyladenosine modification (KEOPS) complex Pcc1 subunit [Arcanobacterium pluranimalium]|uniref:DUF3618 domain-containing protein n=1 Tax=Arcanobacterium pluranimalium TaxID=108028 RepID=UPI0030841EA0|nr:tRNA threonylcarbamoyladenosine modification (KEOPS) complex Pcc1 subunit [Arcanobacterium pluranimalium]
MTQDTNRINPHVVAEARLAASVKKAVDYDAPEGEDNRSAAQIESDLQRIRLELTATVDELAARLDPKNLQEEAKVKAQNAFANASQNARSFLDAVANGDPKALKIFGGCVAAILGLIIVKIIKR